MIIISISKETLKGYLLEEALAFLLKNSGYNLLVDSSQDPQELNKQGNGLVVIGRGGMHQADVLGELTWMPAFTYPLRLFVEAKFRTKKTGIETVRNAIGVLNDLNENYSSMQTRTNNRIIVKRYNYNYAIFSTSGFTKNAADMALAHKISLIDMSGTEYDELRNVIDQAASNCLFLFENTTDTQQQILNFTRKYLRKNLGTWPSHISLSLDENKELILKLSESLLPLISYIESMKELFIGTANGPFLLILQTEHPERFRNFASTHSGHEVDIRWHSTSDDNGITGIITPYVGEEEGYVLTFSFPKVLKDFILQSENPTETALDAKQRFLSSILIYSYKNKKDEIYRIRYKQQR